MAHKSDFDKFYYFMVVTGVVILLVNLYYYAHPLWRSMGWTHEVADSLMLKLRSGGTFSSPWKSKAVGLLLLAASLVSRSGRGAKMPWWQIAVALASGLAVFFFAPVNAPLEYLALTLTGTVLACWGFGMLGRNIGHFNEAKNDRNETFAQCETLLDTPDSINFKTRYYYRGRWRNGWVNCVAPTRGSLVMGVPGSGKSFSIFEPMIEQMISKGYTMFVYDYKYPALTEVVYNELLRHKDAYKVLPEFCVINFNDPRYSLRCNPIDPKFITDPSDTSEIAETVMLNVNKNAVEKEDFFSMSAKLYLDAIIWFLRNYDGGKYCTFPHAIQFMSEDYKKTFRIMSTSDIPGLEFKIKSFVNAMESNAQDQLQGQIASAQIPLGRFISPQLYWVLTGNDFTLDINNPEHPKILCVGNDPQRQAIFGTTLALITSQIFKIINVPHRERCGVLIDEFPTIFLKDIDNVIDTARSNGVGVCLGCQDESQVRRDYGDKQAEVILNTIGNIFSGQVNGKTAENLSKMFGREFRRRESQTRGIESDSVNISFQQEDIMPRSTIETLTQGVFLGKVADTFSHQFNEKFFCGKFIVDLKEYKKKKRERQPLPLMTDFHEKEAREEVLNHSEKYLLDYFQEQIRKDGSIIYDSEGLSQAAEEKVKQLSDKQKSKLVREIADTAAKNAVDDRINRNFLQIQNDIKYIIQKETMRSDQTIAPAGKNSDSESKPTKPEDVDPFVD